MTEPEDTEGSWAAGCLGCSMWLFLLAALMLGVGYYEASRFDPEARCLEREGGRCLKVESGFVESSGGIFDRVTVRYDDGRQKETVMMSGTDEPPKGSRVRLERWDGKIVALVDLRDERRYKTLDWPERWHPAGLAFLGLAAAAAGMWLILLFKERR